MLPIPPIGVSGRRRFISETNAEIRELYIGPRPARAPVEISELDRLPAPVALWLKKAGVVGRPRTSCARLLQRGELRTSPKAPFMQARADQYFRVVDPAFIWRVETKLLRVLSFTGRDRYAAGRGNMRIQLGSVMDVVNVDDQKIAEGALLRFLAEMVWFPSAALEAYIRWEAIDSTRARATLDDANLSVSATFEIDSQGRVAGVTAQRFLGGGEKATLEAWRVTCTDWKRFCGVEVPAVGSVSWDLERGNFVYYRWEITDLEYDQPEPFGQNSIWL